MLAVTPLTQRIDPPRPVTDHDGNEIELTNRLGNLSVSVTVSDATSVTVTDTKKKTASAGGL